MPDNKIFSYLINTNVKTPKAIFDALVLHETFCVASKIRYVTEEEVKDFLLKRFDKKMANRFKAEYLHQIREPYIKGKPKVIAIFKKLLNRNTANTLIYETRLATPFQEKYESTVALEINDIRTIKLDKHWDKTQSNANRLLANKTARLIIYHGNVEWTNKNSKQHISIGVDDISISWRAESIEYVSSILNSLNRSKELSIKVDMAVDDDYFSHNKEGTVELDKISISFQ